MRWRMRTRRPASRALLPECTRATGRCAAISNGVATRSRSRRARWAWRFDDIRLPRPEIELGPPDWFEHLRIIGVPRGFLSSADQAAFHILVARLGGENVATAMAFDLGSDCGIYNVGTLERGRRRGLGTALTAVHVHDALARGCRTASLQSTEMAERVYAAVGFRDLGRILEYVP